MLALGFEEGQARVASMQIVKTPDTEPIPGYRLIEPLGKGGFGEVWKCEAPGGLFKAIKFVNGGNHLTDPLGAGAEQELRALELVKSIRHPFLLSLERVEVIDGELIVVMELADRSLHDLLVDYRAAGQAGIPRDELLDYMRETAEAIDVLNQEHDLQHLDIKPRNLFLIGRHVKVADFGLVTSLSDLQNQSSWVRRTEAVTPLYASPETFLGRFTPYSDQYSLAITYHELLTGTVPIVGSNFRQLALRHVQEPPDLQRLPESERPALARALAKEPRERYPSCGAFIKALRQLSDLPPRSVASQSTKHDIELGELAATPPGTKQVRGVGPASPMPVPASEAAMPSDPQAFLAGYQLLECVNRHAAAEMWKAQTADGRKRLLRLINGYDAAEARPQGDPLLRLRQIHHPNLLPLEIQLGPPGRLALITDAPDGTLFDRLRECQQINRQGIPRAELLSHLKQAAEALDSLYEQHRLQHLCLTPRQLALRNGRLFLLDFALVELLWQPAGQDPAALNTRYAAPELFDHRSSRHCDQYSLALIYQELLTGIPAFRNFNQRQMALARLRGQPDLGLLPATDRTVVSQALHVDPDRRFPNCTAFANALADIPVERGEGSSLRGTHIQVSTVAVPLQPVEKKLERAVGIGPAALACNRPLPEIKQLLAEQVAAAAGVWEVRASGSLRYRFRKPSRGDSRVSQGERAIEAALPCLEHFAFARLLPATVGLKLAGFGEEWQARRIETGATNLAHAAETLPGTNVLYHVRVQGSVWQRYLGKTPGLLVQIELRYPQVTSEGLSDVILRLRPCDCGPEKGVELLEELSPLLLRSLREHLQVPPERRSEERIAHTDNVRVYPMHCNREVGDGIAAQLRDLSLGGLGLHLPCRPPGDLLFIRMGPPDGTALTVPVQTRHVQSLGDGRFHIGTRFAWEILRDFTSR
jgi:serine/threonine protein kinase